MTLRCRTVPAPPETILAASETSTTGGEELADKGTSDGKVAGEVIKKTVCEICNFFHSFLETLTKPEK
jgi:hypothetical protein